MKGKPLYRIDIFCVRCKCLLYVYNKEGPGQLVKCFVDRILKDHTDGGTSCPSCNSEFCRMGEINHRPIRKIINGKVFVRGFCKK